MWCLKKWQLLWFKCLAKNFRLESKINQGLQIPHLFCQNKYLSALSKSYAITAANYSLLQLQSQLQSQWQSQWQSQLQSQLEITNEDDGNSIASVAGELMRSATPTRAPATKKRAIERPSVHRNSTGLPSGQTLNWRLPSFPRFIVDGNGLSSIKTLLSSTAIFLNGRYLFWFTENIRIFITSILYECCHWASVGSMPLT